MSTEWKQRYLRNTLSSYLRVIIRLLTGLVLFRLLYAGLDKEEFGCWSLLWSLFGYGVLLDFGFGFTAQKTVAEQTAQGDYDRLSRLSATIFWTFVALAALAGTVLLVLREPFLAAVQTPDGRMDEFKLAGGIFFAGLAISFPLGLFAEMLRGLQRIDLANYCQTAGVLINFGGILLGLQLGWPFAALVGIGVATVVLPGLVSAWLVFRLIPKLSISPRLFDWRELRPQLGFSMSAYLITFSNLIMARSDQLVIGLVIGVAGVTIYQAAYKVAEMFSLFTVQLQDALSPAAASLRASNRLDEIRELLVRSSRLTFLVTTPLYALCVVYLEELIRLLTGLETVDETIQAAGYILLLATYSSQLTNSCGKRILMMCGHEKKLLVLSLADAGANLLLSLILAYWLGITGVAIGTLLPTVIVGWCWVLPLTLRYLKIGFREFVVGHLVGAFRPLAAFGLVLTILAILVPPGGEGLFPALAWRGLACLLPWAWLSWPELRRLKT